MIDYLPIIKRYRHRQARKQFLKDFFLALLIGLMFILGMGLAGHGDIELVKLGIIH